MASAARREKAWTGAAYATLKAERRDLGAGKRALETLAGAGAALCAQILRRWCVQPANALSTPQRSARLRCVPITILTDVPLARSLGRVRSIAANAGQTGVSAGSLSAGSASGLTPDTVCAALGGVLPNGAELRSVTDATQSCANSLPVPLPPCSLAALLAPCGRI